MNTTMNQKFGHSIEMLPWERLAAAILLRAIPLSRGCKPLPQLSFQISDEWEGAMF
jgi:hypothetical protein